jgi:hypothetical protein
MNGSMRRRLGGSALLALSLATALAGQALAAEWGAPMALTTAGNVDPGGGLVTLGRSTAVAAYARNGKVIVRRSDTSGESWSSPLRLSDGGLPAIAGRGSKVDVVWVHNNRVRYARSDDQGSSFDPPSALSPKGFSVSGPAVARGANGLVVVAWLQAASPPCCDGMWPIVARVSTNGGIDFGPPTTLGSGWQVAAAGGQGVVYVAIDGLVGGSDVGLVLRRSLDGGASWNRKAFAWPHSDELIVRPRDLSMTAEGEHAYVAYQDLTLVGPPEDPTAEWFVGYRRTATKGGGWSAARNLTPVGGADEANGVVGLKAGVLHAAFRSSGAGVWYTRSNDGLVWSAAEQAVAPGTREEYPMGIGEGATRLMILYSAQDWDNPPYPEDVYVVTGSP